MQHLGLDLHRILMRAVVAGETQAALADQFDTALNNMPHGLCMFGADGRLAVINNRFSEMMNLPEDVVLRRQRAPRSSMPAYCRSDLGASGRQDLARSSRRRSGR